MIGNALGDGSSSKKDTNSTEEAKDERTFSQKYKDQLKKDISEEEDDDLGPDDEPTEGGEAGSTDEATNSEEPKKEAEEDEDGTVSSKDMFDEM
jgi:hypothetical protein